MNLTTLSVSQSANQSLSLSERLQHSCQIAKQLEKAGEYEAAYEALGDFWSEQEGAPILEESTGQLRRGFCLELARSPAGWAARTKLKAARRRLRT